ncbi:hypothetical protein MKK88_20420 [Methylobacterium sp. E-005]|uniref:hypothetical protein n=1 Tax=Methylobacterium sp. E-005 TaxID=2836549 RepID=UPI001FBB1A48|nr:hypothetical protein [Methylobacterium sp. E-005]MCJ2088331.1 hypothetical protein [Methylobacterium sp. E-005]
MTMIIGSNGAEASPIGSILGSNASESVAKTPNNDSTKMTACDPACVNIQPCATIRFVPTGTGHNAEPIQGMAPEGAPRFETVAGTEQTVTFGKAGLYGFR